LSSVDTCALKRGSSTWIDKLEEAASTGACFAAGQTCGEKDLIAVLSSPPHLCGNEEAAAIAGVIKAHQARSG